MVDEIANIYHKLWQECHRYALGLNHDEQRQMTKWLNKLEKESASPARQRVRNKYISHLARGLRGGYLPSMFHRDPPVGPLPPLWDKIDLTSEAKKRAARPDAYVAPPFAPSPLKLGAMFSGVSGLRREAAAAVAAAARPGRSRLLQRVSVAVVTPATSRASSLSPDSAEEDATTEHELDGDTAALLQDAAAATNLAELLTAMSSRRARDRGEALRCVADEELREFRDTVRRVLDARGGDLEAALAGDHHHLRRHFDKLQSGAKERLRRAEDSLRRLCPDFDWREYNKRPEYLDEVAESLAGRRAKPEAPESRTLNARKAEYTQLFHKLQHTTQLVKKHKEASEALSRELDVMRSQHHAQQLAMAAVENELDLAIGDLELEARQLRSRRDELADEIASLYVDLDQNEQLSYNCMARSTTTMRRKEAVELNSTAWSSFLEPPAHKSTLCDPAVLTTTQFFRGSIHYK